MTEKSDYQKREEQRQLWRSDADFAFEQAVRWANECSAQNLTYLNYSELHALNKIPEEVSELHQLEWLSLKFTRVEELTAIKNLINLRSLWIGNSLVSKLDPIENLVRLQAISFNNTSVGNLDPLSKLKNLNTIFMEHSQVTDLSVLASHTNLLNGAQNGSLQGGLSFRGAPLDDEDLINLASESNNLDRTIGALNHLRKQKQLPLCRLSNGRDNSPDVLIVLDQDNLGLRFEPLMNELRIATTGADSDLEVSQQQTVQQLHKQLLTKTSQFIPFVLPLDNQLGWGGLHGAASRLNTLLNRSTEEVSERIGEVWMEVVELGSFLEQDNFLKDDRSSATDPLDQHVRRILSSLLQTAAPWVRYFPTARTLDDELSLFQSPAHQFAPAREIFLKAGSSLTVAKEDEKILLALLEAGQRGELQGNKAGSYSIKSAKNLIIGAAGILASFYVGATSSQVSIESPIVQRASELFLSSEREIIDLFSDSASDIRVSMDELLQNLRLQNENRNDDDQLREPVLPASRRDEDDNEDV